MGIQMGKLDLWYDTRRTFLSILRKRFPYQKMTMAEVNESLTTTVSAEHFIQQNNCEESGMKVLFSTKI